MKIINRPVIRAVLTIAAASAAVLTWRWIDNRYAAGYLAGLCQRPTAAQRRRFALSLVENR